MRLAWLRSTCLLALTFSFFLSSVQAADLLTDDPNWWKHAVIYEIYPRSFGDSNGDGIGDLNGITQHLDYLKSLGVDAIWLTPFYPSPQVDFGYDISNYEAIDPQYGTMGDFEHLVAEAKKRGLRVINDMVLNHTSDQDPWFIESKSSRTNPKADWYVWRDGKPDGQPPNNWVSIFGHSAWQYEPSRKQYYYHEFYKEQPDLNWRNPEVRKAMYDTLRFWMKKGVAGFRLDAITMLFEDADLRDEPYIDGTNAFGDKNVNRQYTDNLPEVHDVLKQLHEVTDEFPGRVLIGETYLHTAEDLLKMYGARNDELQLPMDTQLGFLNKLSAPTFRSMLTSAETELKGNTPLFVFENHDNRRLIDRYGDGVHNDAIERLIATLLLTPRDAALIYEGEELGVKTIDPARVEDVKDPIGRLGWPKEKGRDGERLPMPWNGDNDAGFSVAKQTWLPVSPDYKTVNVASQSKQPDSMLNYYKNLLRLRRQDTQLRDGEFIGIDNDNPNVLSYLRKTKDGKAVLVCLNMSSDAQDLKFDLTVTGVTGTHLKRLLASSSDINPTAVDHVSLPPYGSYVGHVEP
jgi:alpha-glucosidase